MKAGDLVFVRGTSLISRLIRLFDKGEFSHVAVAVSETEIIEINWNMKSKIVPFHYDNYEIVDLKLTDSERKHVSAYSKGLTGIWYDYTQILGYLIMNNKFNNPRYLICSELAYTILFEINRLPKGSNKDVTPNGLYKLLKDEGY